MRGGATLRIFACSMSKVEVGQLVGHVPTWLLTCGGRQCPRSAAATSVAAPGVGFMTTLSPLALEHRILCINAQLVRRRGVALNSQPAFPPSVRTVGRVVCIRRSWGIKVTRIRQERSVLCRVPGRLIALTDGYDLAYEIFPVCTGFLLQPPGGLYLWTYPQEYTRGIHRRSLDTQRTQLALFLSHFQSPAWGEHREIAVGVTT